MLMVPISGTNVGTNVGTKVVKNMSNVKLSNTWTMEEVHKKKKLT